ILAFFPIGCEEPAPELPYFGINQMVDGEAHTVPKFAFLNQDSIETSHRDFENHIFVTDFFFTTCPSICPVMTSQMSRLQDMLKKEGLWGEVKILSHTVNPEGDRPHVLKAYADNVGADLEHWHFVTGTQDELYHQAKAGYYMTALVSDTAAGGFFHSDNFVLVDREMHIRGYYDGTSTKSVNQLLEDIKTLQKHSQHD
ncbi:MAG: SCO family protein, partial [Bacteroidota bacterium]